MATTRKAPTFLGILLLAALLLVGLHTLFSLRFSSGEVYPAYSSFRADPMGTKILYRALDEMPGFAVSRKLRLWNTAERADESCMLVLNSRLSSVRSIFEDIPGAFMSSGGRLVVAFDPADEWHSWELEDDSDEDSDDVEESDAAAPESDPADTPEPEVAIEVLHAIDAEILQFDEDELKELELEPLAESEADGSIIPWYGLSYFSQLDDSWNVLYRFNGEPVVIERAWGAGSVVLMCDSYLFSNESMVMDRHVDVLLRMIGDSRYILFDEYHLGVSSQESIMMLAARYRLRGVLLALLVVAALYIWQRMSPFIPRYAAENNEDNTVGSWVGSGEGFRNLLIRHIPVRDLARTMVEEWDSTFDGDPAMKTRCEAVRKMYQELLKDNTQPDPLFVHNRMVEKLKERKHTWRIQ